MTAAWKSHKECRFDNVNDSNHIYLSGMRWLRSSDRAVVSGISIEGPAWLVESKHSSPASADCSAVIADADVGVAPQDDADYTTTARVDSYSLLTPTQKLRYLKWLSNRRRIPAEQAFLWIWLYGIERIVLIEARMGLLSQGIINDLIETLSCERQLQSRPLEFRKRVSALQCVLDQGYARQCDPQWVLDTIANELSTGSGLSPQQVFACLDAFGYVLNGNPMTFKAIRTQLLQCMGTTREFYASKSQIKSLPERVFNYEPSSPALRLLGRFSFRLRGTVDLLKHKRLADYLSAVARILKLTLSSPVAIDSIRRGPTLGDLSDEERTQYEEWVDGATCPKVLSEAFSLIFLKTVERRYLAHLARTLPLSEADLGKIEKNCIRILSDEKLSPQLCTSYLNFLSLTASDDLSLDPLATSPVASHYLEHEPTLLRVLHRIAEENKPLQPELFAAWAWHRCKREGQFLTLSDGELRQAIGRLYEANSSSFVRLPRSTVMFPFQYIPISCKANRFEELTTSISCADMTAAGDLNAVYDECTAALSRQLDAPIAPREASEQSSGVNDTVAEESPSLSHDRSIGRQTEPQLAARTPSPAKTDRDHVLNGARWYGLGDSLKLYGYTYAAWMTYVRDSPSADDPSYAVVIRLPVIQNNSVKKKRFSSPIAGSYPELSEAERGRFLHWLVGKHSSEADIQAFSLIHLKGLEARYFAHMSGEAPLEEPELNAIEDRVFVMLQAVSENHAVATYFLDFLTLLSADKLSSDPLVANRQAARHLHHQETVLRAIRYDAVRGEPLSTALACELVWRTVVGDNRYTGLDEFGFKERFALAYDSGQIPRIVVTAGDELKPFRYESLRDICGKRSSVTVNLHVPTDKITAEVIERILVDCADLVMPTHVIPTRSPSRSSKITNPVNATAVQQSPPKRRRRLDWDKVAVIQSDSAVSQRYLDTILATDDASVATEAFVSAEPWSSLALLRELAKQESWQRAMLESIARTHGMMLDGALSQLNERALDELDQALLYGDDPVEVDLDVAAQLLRQMEM